jgi:hypothetical protein
MAFCRMQYRLSWQMEDMGYEYIMNGRSSMLYMNAWVIRFFPVDFRD